MPGWHILAIALFCSLFYSSWAAPVNATHILIGQVNSLTGGSSANGRHMCAGLVIAFAEVNAAGGIHGRNLSLITLDDASNPVQGLERFKELVNVHDVLFVAGIGPTETVRSVEPLLLQKGIPSFGPMTGAALSRVPFREEYINVRVGFADEAVAIAALIVEHLQMQHIACFYQNDGLGIAGLDGLANALQYVGHQLVSNASYERNTLNVSDGVEVILGAPVRPQVVVVIGLQGPTVKFLQVFRQHPLADPNCTFVLMSSTSSSSFGPAVGPTHWHHVYFSQVVPLPNDPRSAMAQRFSKIARRYHPFNGGPDLMSLQGYMVGRLAAETLKNVPPDNITRRAVLDALYSRRVLVMDDLTFGYYNRKYPGCEALLCGCNTGLHDVYMMTFANDGTLYADPSLPTFRYPMASCLSPVDVIRRPIIFGQVLPSFDAAWRAVALEIGRGIAAAFEDANENDVLGGRKFILHQQEYSSEDKALSASEELSQRYPLAAFLGSVLPFGDSTNTSIPMIGSQVIDFQCSEKRQFVHDELHIQPNLPHQFMALVQFAVDKSCGSIHFRAPDNADGEAALNLLRRTIHTFQRDPTSSAVYSDAKDALNGLDEGCVVGLGNPASIRTWLPELTKKPNLWLLIPQSSALAISNDTEILQSVPMERLFFPMLPALNASQQSLSHAAYELGYLSGSAVVYGLSTSSFARMTYTLPGHITDAFYEKGTITLGTTMLGPYSSTECTPGRDDGCECNYGSGKFFIMNGSPDALKDAYIYLPHGCYPSYVPYDVPLIIGLSASLGSTFLITVAICMGFGWRWLREVQRMKKQFSNDNIAEKCAAAIACFDLASLQWLNAVQKPNKIQRSFIAIVSLLTEVKPYIPDQLLAQLTADTVAKDDAESEDSASVHTEAKPAPLSPATARHHNKSQSEVGSCSAPPTPSPHRISVTGSSQLNSPSHTGPRHGIINRRISGTRDWTQRRCTYMSVKLGFKGVVRDATLPLLTDTMTKLIVLGKSNGAIIDKVSMDSLALHWGVSVGSSSLAMAAVNMSMEMASVKAAIPVEHQAAFWMHIGIGKGFCDCGTLSAAGHRFFVVWGPEAALAQEITTGQLPAKFECTVLISDAVYQEVRYNILCMPRMWHNDVLLWEPVTIRSTQQDEWMYELKDLDTAHEYNDKTLHKVFLAAKSKQATAAELACCIQEVKDKYDGVMSAGDHLALRLLTTPRML